MKKFLTCLALGAIMLGASGGAAARVDVGVGIYVPPPQTYYPAPQQPVFVQPYYPPVPHYVPAPGYYPPREVYVEPNWREHREWRERREEEWRRRHWRREHYREHHDR